MTCLGLGVMLASGAVKAQSESTSDASDTTVCKDLGVTLTFDVGSTAINGRGRTSLNQVVKWVKGNQDRSVRVDGYTDQTGNAARNQVLSERRATTVKSYLVSGGVDPAKIDTTGHGENAGERADLKNTRAVAVTACETATPTPQAAAPPPPAEEPPTPPPEKPTIADAPAPVEVPVMPPPIVLMAPPPPPPPAPAPKSNLPPSTIGLAFTLGAGATGFVDEGARAFVDTGGSWEARMVFGTRLPIAFEGAYVGSAQGIQALGLASDAVLLGNGAEGDARLNLTRSRIQPYIFGGAGWMNYQVRNTQIATSDLQRSDNVVTIPFGVGVAARLGTSFLLDLRGTGRATFDDGLLKQVAATASAGDAHLNNWNAGLHLGWEF